MSLLVWLPLNKDLRNNGLFNNTPYTADGTTQDGVARKFTLQISLKYIPDLNTKSCTLCGWFKFNKSEIATKLESITYSSSATSATGNLLGNDNYAGIGIIWQGNAMYTSKVFNTLSIKGCIRSTQMSSRATGSFNVEFDTWIHVIVDFDYDKRILRLYKNGILTSTVSAPAATDLPSRAIYIDWGAVWGGNGPGASIPFYAKDIRVYDHSLSLKEIKELTRGLYVHYKFDDIYLEDSTNLCSTLTVGTLTASITCTNLGNGKYHVKYSKNPSYSSLTVGSYRIYFPLSVLLGHEADQFYYQFKYKRTTGSGDFITFDWCDNGAILVVLKIITDDYTWLVLKMPKFSSTKYSSTYRFLDINSATIGDEFDIWDLKLEMNNNGHWTPCIAGNNPENIMYDCSGFENDASINGTLTLNDSASRYDKCTVFDGSTYISGPIIPAGSILSATLWVYIGASTPTSLIVFVDYNSKLALGFWSSGIIVACNGSCVGVYEKSVLKLNSWNHFAIIRQTGSANPIFYLNGVLLTAKSTDYWNTTTAEFTIGKRAKTGSAYPFSGKICDFRLYSKVLTEDDINEILILASLDNKGTLYPYNINEVGYNDTSLNIKSTGVLYTKNIIEDTLIDKQASFEKTGNVLINQIKEK